MRTSPKRSNLFNVISHKLDSKWLKIYLFDTLHLSVYLDDLYAIQAWIEVEGWFCVNLYLGNLEEPILLEYTDETRWKAVLKVLEENV